MSLRAIIKLHDGLARWAPGDDEATREALRRLGPLPANPRVLDLGCGPGRSTLALAAELPTARIEAVDLHAGFLAHLDRIAAEFAGRIIPRVADFGALDDAPASVDLIWSEGAIYHLGFAAGLRRWRPLLRPQGRIAVTELTWRLPPGERPAEAASFWDEAYPAMTSVAANLAAAESAGYAVIDSFALPASAWFNYYDPLIARADALTPDADPELAAAIAVTRREVDIWRRHGDCYDYVFYLLRPA